MRCTERGIRFSMDDRHLVLLCNLVLFFMRGASSSGGSVLILPLQLQAQSSSNGVMLTADKLLSFRHNVTLTVTLAVGTPPQEVSLVLDTGSELSWLRCNSSFFDPGNSSSYASVPCSSSTCSAKTKDFTNPVSCDSNKLCHVILSYADASSAEGSLATESFEFGGGSAALPEMVFGCMDTWSSSTPEEDLKTAGLIGLNRGALSFVNQMGFPEFSYCISGSDSSGVLLFGKADLPWLMPLNYTPLVQMSTPLPYFDRVAYTVQLEGIRVENTVLPLPKSILEPDHTGAGQTMVDSGTQFTFLMGPVYNALKNEFSRQTQGILRPLGEPDFVFQGTMDLCYRIELNRTFLPALPRVSLLFAGAEMSVSGENLLYRVPGMNRNGDGVHCLTFGNSDLLGVEANVIGHHQQRNLWVEFDLAGSRVGFGEFKCDLAGQRLGLPP